MRERSSQTPETTALMIRRDQSSPALCTHIQRGSAFQSRSCNRHCSKCSAINLDDVSAVMSSFQLAHVCVDTGVNAAISLAYSCSWSCRVRGASTPAPPVLAARLQRACMPTSVHLPSRCPCSDQPTTISRRSRCVTAVGGEKDARCCLRERCALQWHASDGINLFQLLCDRFVPPVLQMPCAAVSSTTINQQHIIGCSRCYGRMATVTFGTMNTCCARSCDASCAIGRAIQEREDITQPSLMKPGIAAAHAVRRRPCRSKYAAASGHTADLGKCLDVIDVPIREQSFYMQFGIELH